jgi:hypothetical protein
MKKFKGTKVCTIGANCKGACIQRNKNCLTAPTPRQRVRIRQAHRLLSSAVDILPLQKSGGKISAATALLGTLYKKHDKDATNAIADRIKIIGTAEQAKIVSGNLRDFHQMIGRDTGVKRVVLLPERSKINPTTGTITLDSRKAPTQWRQLLFHELGHAVENLDAKYLKESKGFINSRATGPAQSMNSLTNSTKYQSNEMGYPGKFLHPYVSKVYPNSTEVISMGLEHFSSPLLMSKFYKEDPEHFKLVLNVISGY